jgi:copper chaperone CopZ
METLTIRLPAMYGDHHVLEVRRILLELPGITGIDASSCFQVVEITYDPALLSSEKIESTLAEAGYLQDLSSPVESGTSAYGTESPDTYFRHTTAFEQTRQVVGFAQNVTSEGRPLWPCPGLGVLPLVKEEEHA